MWFRYDFFFFFLFAHTALLFQIHTHIFTSIDTRIHWLLYIYSVIFIHAPPPDQKKITLTRFRSHFQIYFPIHSYFIRHIHRLVYFSMNLHSNAHSHTHSSSLPSHILLTHTFYHHPHTHLHAHTHLYMIYMQINTLTVTHTQHLHI